MNAYDLEYAGNGLSNCKMVLKFKYILGYLRPRGKLWQFQYLTMIFAIGLDLSLL